MKNTQINPRITPRDFKSFDAYLREINKIPIPSVEEEVMLAQRIHQGDEQALERLVTGHLRFVVSVAKQFMNNGVHYVSHLARNIVNLASLYHDMCKYEQEEQELGKAIIIYRKLFEESPGEYMREFANVLIPLSRIHERP